MIARPTYLVQASRIAFGQPAKPHSFAVCLVAVVAVALIGLPKHACASNPVLRLITPCGIQRGQTHTLTFDGVRLQDAEEIFFYDSGLLATAIKPVNGNKIEVTVDVNANCRLGEHVAQVRTSSGISDYRIVYVEAPGTVAEAEPNDRRQSPQLLDPVAYDQKIPQAIGVVVGGSLRDEDHDWFAVEGTQGERLSIEVVGMRLGAYCDATLQLFDPQGKLLAEVDDTPLTRQDPYVSLTLPSDGRYLIHLADASGRGGDNCRYRLHVGNFPRPAFAVPFVVSANDQSSVSFVGDAAEPIGQADSLDASDLWRDQLHMVDQYGSTPTPVPMWRKDYLVVAEQEPNQTHKQWDALKKSPLTIPAAAYGKIDNSGDADTFCVEASKGQVLRIETFGQRAGSPIDTTLRIYNASGRRVAQNLDVIGVDSRLRFVVPANGKYYLQVSDAQRRFGSTVRYFLSIEEVRPSAEIGIKSLDRFEQRRQAIAVPAGNRFALNVIVKRDDYDGPIRLKAADLPKGVRMIARTIPAGVSEWPVVFEAADLPIAEQETQEKTEKAADVNAADADRPPQDPEPTLLGGLLPLVGVRVADDGDERNDDGDDVKDGSIIGHYVNRAQMMRVAPNNMTFHQCEVDRVASAVLEPASFKVELVPPSPLAQNGQLSLQVNVTRDEGFEQPITLRVPYRSPGVGARGAMTVKPNQSSVRYPINANRKASVGVWPICLTATAPHRGEVMVSTGLHDLEIVEPFVAVSAPLVTVAAGGSVDVACSIDRLHQFAGKATAKLIGLPPGASAQPLKFGFDDKEIKFVLTLTESCPLGKHQSVACQVTIVKDGQPIVFKAGTVGLRIMKSKRAAKSATVAAVPPQEGT